MTISKAIYHDNEDCGFCLMDEAIELGSAICSSDSCTESTPAINLLTSDGKCVRSTQIIGTDYAIYNIPTHNLITQQTLQQMIVSTP